MGFRYSVITKLAKSTACPNGYKPWDVACDHAVNSCSCRKLHVHASRFHPFCILHDRATACLRFLREGERSG